MSISSIFCVVFDNEKGPITKGSSHNTVECGINRFSDVSSKLGRYFCPDQLLCGRSVHILDDSDYEYCGIPIYIADEAYARSCFRFCIVIGIRSSDSTADSSEDVGEKDGSSTIGTTKRNRDRATENDDSIGNGESGSEAKNNTGHDSGKVDVRPAGLNAEAIENQFFKDQFYKRARVNTKSTEQKSRFLAHFEMRLGALAMNLARVFRNLEIDLKYVSTLTPSYLSIIFNEIKNQLYRMEDPHIPIWLPFAVEDVVNAQKRQMLNQQQAEEAKADSNIAAVGDSANSNAHGAVLPTFLETDHRDSPNILRSNKGIPNVGNPNTENFGGKGFHPSPASSKEESAPVHPSLPADLPMHPTLVSDIMQGNRCPITAADRAKAPALLHLKLLCTTVFQHRRIAIPKFDSISRYPFFRAAFACTPRTTLTVNSPVYTMLMQSKRRPSNGTSPASWHATGGNITDVNPANTTASGTAEKAPKMLKKHHTTMETGIRTDKNYTGSQFSEHSVNVNGGGANGMMENGRSSPKNIAKQIAQEENNTAVSLDPSLIPILITGIEPAPNILCDLTLWEVLPFIDGLNNISEIVELSMCEPENVELVLRHLVFRAMVVLVPPIHNDCLYVLKGNFRSYILHVKGICEKRIKGRRQKERHSNGFMQTIKNTADASQINEITSNSVAANGENEQAQFSPDRSSPDLIGNTTHTKRSSQIISPHDGDMSVKDSSVGDSGSPMSSESSSASDEEDDSSVFSASDLFHFVMQPRDEIMPQKTEVQQHFSPSTSGSEHTPTSWRPVAVSEEQLELGNTNGLGNTNVGLGNTRDSGLRITRNSALGNTRNTIFRRKKDYRQATRDSIVLLILQLYCQLRPHERFGDFRVRNAKVIEKVNEIAAETVPPPDPVRGTIPGAPPSRFFSLRHFIIFGIWHDFIRRILEYPVVYRNIVEERTRQDRFFVLNDEYQKISEAEFELCAALCDGSLHVDHLAVLLRRPYANLKYLLDTVLSKDPVVKRILYMRR